jgi:hypothetical protein
MPAIENQSTATPNGQSTILNCYETPAPLDIAPQSSHFGFEADPVTQFTDSISLVIR